MPTVSVIVVNWNGKKVLPGCLASLYFQTFRDFETIVVDNGSSDGSADGINARVIYLPENRGFSGGNNVGIRAAKGKYIALLNNDAKADNSWLKALVEAAEKHPEAGMFASKILRANGRLESAGCYVHPDGNGMRRTKYGEAITFPSGCAALYRKSMLDEIGLFDERFFMYNEDTDLGLRAQKAGWRCLYVPTAIVTHLYSQSSSAYSLKKLFWVERNRIKIMLKHFTFRKIVVSIPWTTQRYFQLLKEIA